jgi:hypothetical protein
MVRLVVGETAVRNVFCNMMEAGVELRMESWGCWWVIMVKCLSFHCGEMQRQH